jgi:hypothetical protein
VRTCFLTMLGPLSWDRRNQHHAHYFRAGIIATL